MFGEVFDALIQQKAEAAMQRQHGFAQSPSRNDCPVSVSGVPPPGHAWREGGPLGRISGPVRLLLDGGQSPAADRLNHRVIPFFDERGLRIDRVLIDRDIEFCGAQDRHDYTLYFAVESIDYTWIKRRNPQKMMRPSDQVDMFTPCG